VIVRCRLLVGCVLALLAAAPAANAAASSASKAKAPKTQYYLSMGDSYAVGYQATVKKTTLNGPANQLVPLAAKRGYHYKLVNIGCGGATTTSLLTKIGCDQDALAPGAAGYPNQTQTQAAVAFIKKHPGKVGLVTISISGNDVTPCIPQQNAISCVAAKMHTVTANLGKIVRQLRAAGGKQMRIIGSTYPDVVLGAWVIPQGTFGATSRYMLATESLTSFQKYINPGLKRTYQSVGGAFVDVTAATGAYGPFVTTNTATYGTVPTPVAEVCKLTYFCKYTDIHMTTAGYAIIARLEAATLPKVKG
jgi:hypothetical protein